MLNIIPEQMDLFLRKAQTWEVIMFALGGALRLREGVELSSGNSFRRQPENKPWCCSGDLAGHACSPCGMPVAPLAQDGSWPCMAPQLLVALMGSALGSPS